MGGVFGTRKTLLLEHEEQRKKVGERFSITFEKAKGNASCEDLTRDINRMREILRVFGPQAGYLKNTKQLKGQPMKAEEARRISEQRLSDPEPLLKLAYDRIKNAADRGEKSIRDPFQRLRKVASPELMRDAVQRLREDGYTVKYHENPDPGDPKSSGYIEVSW